MEEERRYTRITSKEVEELLREKVPLRDNIIKIINKVRKQPTALWNVTFSTYEFVKVNKSQAGMKRKKKTQVDKSRIITAEAAAGLAVARMPTDVSELEERMKKLNLNQLPFEWKADVKKEDLLRIGNLKKWEKELL